MKLDINEILFLMFLEGFFIRLDVSCISFRNT